MILPRGDGWTRSLRHFLGELLTVTAGILIALALDGMVDRREERKQAREAIANMRSEIADNLGDLEGARAGYPRVRASLEENLAAIRTLQAGGRPKSFTRRVGLPTVALTASSLGTAEATGALRHLDYGEARRFADVFSVQQEFVRQQTRLTDHWQDTTPVGDEDLRLLTPAELAARAVELTLALRHLVAVQDWAKVLADSYRGRLPAPAKR
jgi:hypothetical protein